MTFDLSQILASKRAFRRELASRDLEEKLAMLDELRARTVALRAASSDLSTVRERPSTYLTPPVR